MFNLLKKLIGGEKNMKKGNVGLIAGTIITLVLAVIIIVSLAIPQAQTMTTAQEYSDTLTAHVKGAGATTTTLTETDMVTGGLTVTGLTLTTNYTVSYTTGVVTVLNNTANGTYTAGYTFYEEGYIENTSTRALAMVIVLVLIIGLVYAAFQMFGAV